MAESGDNKALAGELAQRCLPLLAPMSWPQRLKALMEMHDQLREDIKDFAVFCEVFPRFVETLVERLGEGPIECFEQAQIYANSGRSSHRDAAGAWIDVYYDARKKPSVR
jgi:hypothetical protein